MPSERAQAAPERTFISPRAMSTFAGSSIGAGGTFGGTFAGGSDGDWSSFAGGGDAALPGAMWRGAEAPAVEYVSPATPERSRLPDGRQPRGGFIWPRAASFSPATSAAVEQANGNAERARVEAAPGTPLWEAMRPPPMVQLQGGNGPGEATASTNADVELARPFLELVKGGLESSQSDGVRFFEQSAPVAQAVAPSSEAASRMVDAVRAQPQHVPGDDRVSLADLTLISVASATGQLAASEEGGRPQPVAPGGGGGGGGEAHHAGGKGGGGAPADLEDLARKVFEELQRHIEIERERSGTSWER
jgi:hypothetical protein